MERFYWAVLVHPKYDQEFRKQKEIEVEEYMQSRHSEYSQRELISQLYVPELEETIFKAIGVARDTFNGDKDIEQNWSNQTKEFLSLLSGKYLGFFSMFSRINQVHIFTLYALTLINNETELSFETKRIFERLISLLHTPISIEDFHKPDFENFRYLGEKRGELLQIIKRYPNRDLRDFVDFSRLNRDGISIIKKALTELANNRKIKRTDEFHYEIDLAPEFEEVEEDEKSNN